MNEKKSIEKSRELFKQLEEKIRTSSPCVREFRIECLEMCLEALLKYRSILERSKK